MAVKSIVLLTETNGYDAADHYDDTTQGTTYELVRIYKIESTDGSVQYFKHVITLGSYGTAEAGDVSTKFLEVKPVEKTVTVFE